MAWDEMARSGSLTERLSPAREVHNGESLGVVPSERLEDVLRRRTELFQALLEAQREAGEGLAIVDGERPLYVNGAFCQITGYSLDELLMLPSLLDIVVPEEREQIVQQIQGARPTARPSPTSKRRSSTMMGAVSTSRLA